MALVLLGMAKSHGMRLPKKAESPFEKIIDNAAKGLTTTPGLLTIMARHEFSKKWFNASDEAIITEMTQRLAELHDVKLNDVQLKRWRYSQVATPFQKAYAQAPIPIPLYLIGDGFCGGGLGGAIQSANALAKLF